MKTYTYIGSRTTKERNARGRGLEVCRINDAGQWLPIQVVTGQDNPSYQCMDRHGETLYSVHGDLDEMDAFRIDRETGKLQLINVIHGIGKNPVYCTVSEDGRHVYTASLQGGCVTVLPRQPHGFLGEPIQVLKFPGKEEGALSMAHQCILDHSGQYLFVPTQSRGRGYAQICVCRVLSDGTLEVKEYFRNPHFAEPRHAAVSPDNRFVYVADEKGDQIHVLLFDQATGHLAHVQSISTLPQTLRHKTAWPGGIQMNSAGNRVYVSNRTYASISVFSADQRTGCLSFLQNVPTYGKTPRFFCLNPDETILSAANEDSDTIELFDIKSDGCLQYTGNSVRTPSPVCQLFLNVP